MKNCWCRRMARSRTISFDFLSLSRISLRLRTRFWTGLFLFYAVVAQEVYNASWSSCVFICGAGAQCSYYIIGSLELFVERFPSIPAQLLRNKKDIESTHAPIMLSRNPKYSPPPLNTLESVLLSRLVLRGYKTLD